MSTMQERVAAEISARVQDEKDRVAEAREKRREECNAEYEKFFGEPPEITREEIDGEKCLVASGHGFRFAWKGSRASGYNQKLTLIRTCPDCGREWVSDDYLYVIQSDLTRYDDMSGAVAKRIADMHTGYVPKHDCEERGRIAAKAGVREAARLLHVPAYEIVARLADDWAV